MSAAPAPPAALFSRLPTKRVLTLNIDVPEAWLVEVTQVRTGKRRRARVSVGRSCCVLDSAGKPQ